METEITSKASSPFRFLRFSLRSVLVFTFVMALSLCYLTSNLPHWNAVRRLERCGVKIVYRREEPSLLDKCLSIYRLDEIDHLSKITEAELRPISDLSFVGDLRSLDYFSDELFYDPSERYDFLIPISDKIKHLSFRYLPEDSRNYLSHFKNLTDFYTGSDLDFNALPEAFPVKSIFIRGGLPKNIRSLPNLKQLEISKGGQTLKLLTFAELSPLHLESIWLENTSIQILDTACEIENYVCFDFPSDLIIVDAISCPDLVSSLRKWGGVPNALSEFVDGRRESKWINVKKEEQDKSASDNKIMGPPGQNKRTSDGLN